jgi:hypothetical protein
MRRPSAIDRCRAWSAGSETLKTANGTWPAADAAAQPKAAPLIAAAISSSLPK